MKGMHNLEFKIKLNNSWTLHYNYTGREAMVKRVIYKNSQKSYLTSS